MDDLRLPVDQYYPMEDREPMDRLMRDTFERWLDERTFPTFLRVCRRPDLFPFLLALLMADGAQGHDPDSPFLGQLCDEIPPFPDEGTLSDPLSACFGFMRGVRILRHERPSPVVEAFKRLFVRYVDQGYPLTWALMREMETWDDGQFLDTVRPWCGLK